ncbi:MAG: patatin-like phospholipase family protein, partial [Planctomycetota bacterium]|nr:patatin-like phospholipase family protein [Planctomycetota bacterium]
MNACRSISFLLSTFVAVAAGCAHRAENQRLRKYSPDAGYRFNLYETGENNTNSLFVALAFSGGGTRAAALSYGVLKKLANTYVEWPYSGQPARLLDEVDLISSVSGGAFTAAYYRLFGDRIFDDFEKKVLKRDLQGELTRRIINPLNWHRLSSFWFDRIDLAAELYGETIFEGKTFGDITGSPRPFVIINATNMAMGSQFPFTQDQFDLLGSDLGSYPVANAVAASAAVPVALSPVTLRNHPASSGYRLPEWIRENLADPTRDAKLFRRAKSLAPYHEKKKRHRYVHLLDGGISDNLGLGVLLDEFRQGYIQQLVHGVSLDEELPVQRIENLLLIVVNARNKLDDGIDRSSFSPGIFAAAYHAANISIDHHSYALLDFMQGSLAMTRRAQKAIDDVQELLDRFSPDPPDLPKILRTRIYLVEINFE